MVGRVLCAINGKKVRPRGSDGNTGNNPGRYSWRLNVKCLLLSGLYSMFRRGFNAGECWKLGWLKKFMIFLQVVAIVE